MSEATLPRDGRERFLSAVSPIEIANSELAALRRSLLSQFEETPLPTRRDESWKYCDLRPLAKTEWSVPHPKAAEAVTDADLEAFIYWEQSAARVVFVDGRFSDRLSRLDDLPDGLFVSSFSADPDEAEDTLRKSLARSHRPAAETFDRLNAGGFSDGVIVIAEPKAQIDRPVHVLHLNTGQTPAALVQTRGVVVAGPESRFHLVERHVGLAEQANYFSNVVLDVTVEANAEVEVDRVQRESYGSTHFGLTRIFQSRDSRFRATSVGFGAERSRHRVLARQEESGARTEVNGLFIGRGQQLHDNQVVMEHHASHGESTQLFKGILDDESTGVFNGTIVVPQHIQATEAEQTSANLLLSSKANVNAKPQLEIDADDVKCAHGATIGALDSAQLFYLQSRGIGAERARGMLTAAFAGEVIDAIGVAPMRERLQELLSSSLTWEAASETEDPS